jgi:hypothetical protein
MSISGRSGERLIESSDGYADGLPGVAQFNMEYAGKPSINGLAHYYTATPETSLLFLAQTVSKPTCRNKHICLTFVQTDKNIVKKK